MKKWTEVPISDLVLEKNNQFIVFNKPPGIAVQADPSGDRALEDLARIYTKGPVWVTHRIDRPASGVVLFAKSANGLAAINAQFKARKIKKTYLAVVGQLPEPSTGKLIHHLVKNGKTNRSKAFTEEVDGSKRAELEYRLLESIDNYHLLEVKLLTGRHHQIRAQLAAIGSPIKGDVKYGARRSNRDRSIHLHAWKLAFEHPVTAEPVELAAPVPQDPVWDAFNFTKTTNE